jgi:hypothetical protein
VQQDMSAGAGTELSVQAVNVLQLYNDYLQKRYVVNRRYQRKLVWSVEEKELLIDSISQDLPIPLILLAENKDGSTGIAKLEVIDGLQRLNAIFAFIENEFALGGEYFDLETLGDTKLQKDRGSLTQQGPILDRAFCTEIANYQLPVSIYRSATESAVDEVFRRINSSGKHLSLQEVRQAGATGRLAHLVRGLSATVRGDVSLTDYLQLSDMRKISITNSDLDYGIYVEDIFWVKQGILTRDSVRESRDEELVLDIVLDLILDPIASTGPRYRDSAYGIERGRGTTSAALVSRRLASIGVEEVEKRFLDTLEVFRKALAAADKPFAALTVTQQNYRGVPRHFHALFVAVAQLLHEDGRKLGDVSTFAKALQGFWDADLRVPSGGGDWGAERKTNLIRAIKAQLFPVFPESDSKADREVQENLVRFEATLRMALTEEALFELKQGFCSLANSHGFDETSFLKIMRTASAMANTSSQAKGYIFIGVADDEQDAKSVERFTSVTPLALDGFYVTGTQHELDSLGKSVDEMWRDLLTKIQNSKLDPAFSQELAQSLRPLRYRGFLVWMLEPKSIGKPVTYDGKFFHRVGPRTVELTGNSIIDLARKFPQ